MGIQWSGAPSLVSKRWVLGSFIRKLLRTHSAPAGCTCRSISSAFPARRSRRGGTSGEEGTMYRAPTVVVIKILQVQSEFRVRLEIPSQPQSRLRVDPPPLVHNFPIRVAGTCSSSASLFTDKPSGFMKSSRKISPGCTGAVNLSLFLIVRSHFDQFQSRKRRPV